MSVDDPEQQGRVLVEVPSLAGSQPAWAPTLRDLAGAAVGDEVLVGYDAGRIEHPYVVGVLATGTPPAVALVDDDGNTVRLSASGIDLTSAGEVHIRASSVRITASSGLADTGLWTFTSAVKTETLIAESVIASSYSPGAGNIS